MDYCGQHHPDMPSERPCIADSPLEQPEFETSVALAKYVGLSGGKVLPKKSTGVGEPLHHLSGTDGSNPSLSASPVVRCGHNPAKDLYWKRSVEERAMTVLKVGFVGIISDRLDKTVAPFRDVIGVPVTRRTNDLVGFRLVDGTVLKLYGPSNEFHAFFTTGRRGDRRPRAIGAPSWAMLIAQQRRAMIVASHNQTTSQTRGQRWNSGAAA
jgi:hypothetical protein